MELKAQVKVFPAFKMVLQPHDIVMLRLVEDADRIPYVLLLCSSLLLLADDLDCYLLMGQFVHTFADH